MPFFFPMLLPPRSSPNGSPSRLRSFFFFPQSKDLKFANSEELELTKILYQKGRDWDLDVTTRKHITKEEFLKFFKGKPNYSIVHFGGHSDSQGLYFPDGVLKIGEFIERVKNVKGLFLIFLNGCNSIEIAKQISNVTTASIIATDNIIDDFEAFSTSTNFYGFLCMGYSIETSFQLSMKENQYRLHNHRGTTHPNRTIRHLSNECFSKVRTNWIFISNRKSKRWRLTSLYLKFPLGLEKNIFIKVLLGYLYVRLLYSLKIMTL